MPADQTWFCVDDEDETHYEVCPGLLTQARIEETFDGAS